MNALVAVLIASSTFCSEPAVDFRSFYGRFFLPTREGQYWAAVHGETTDGAVRRVLDATADFADYRAARMERCR